MVNFVGQGNEQHGWRPAVIFQNNTGNKFSPNVVVLPLTSSIKKKDLPTHVFIPAGGDTGIVKDSIVLCENPKCITKERLGSYIATLPESYLAEIAKANLLASSAIAYIPFQALLQIYQKSLDLNYISK